jgi:hypothetical protein
VNKYYSGFFLSHFVAQFGQLLHHQVRVVEGGAAVDDVPASSTDAGAA